MFCNLFDQYSFSGFAAFCTVQFLLILRKYLGFSWNFLNIIFGFDIKCLMQFLPDNSEINKYRQHKENFFMNNNFGGFF